MAATPHKTSPVLAVGERKSINRIAAAHGALNVRVFGSVRRGESNGASDLDLLVDMAEGRSLLDLVALGDDLEEELGVVDKFFVSPMLQDAVVRNLEIVGEAAKRVTPSMRERRLVCRGGRWQVCEASWPTTTSE